MFLHSFGRVKNDWLVISNFKSPWLKFALKRICTNLAQIHGGCTHHLVTIKKRGKYRLTIRKVLITNMYHDHNWFDDFYLKMPQNFLRAGCRDGYVRAERKRECESANCEHELACLEPQRAAWDVVQLCRYTLSRRAATRLAIVHRDCWNRG